MVSGLHCWPLLTVLVSVLSPIESTERSDSQEIKKKQVQKISAADRINMIMSHIKPTDHRKPINYNGLEDAFRSFNDVNRLFKADRNQSRMFIGHLLEKCVTTIQPENSGFKLLDWKRRRKRDFDITSPFRGDKYGKKIKSEKISDKSSKKDNKKSNYLTGSTSELIADNKPDPEPKIKPKTKNYSYHITLDIDNENKPNTTLNYNKVGLVSVNCDSVCHKVQTLGNTINDVFPLSMDMGITPRPRVRVKRSDVIGDESMFVELLQFTSKKPESETEHKDFDELSALEDQVTNSSKRTLSKVDQTKSYSTISHYQYVNCSTDKLTDFTGSADNPITSTSNESTSSDTGSTVKCQMTSTDKPLDKKDPIDPEQDTSTSNNTHLNRMPSNNNQSLINTDETTNKSIDKDTDRETTESELQSLRHTTSTTEGLKREGSTSVQDVVTATSTDGVNIATQTLSEAKNALNKRNNRLHGVPVVRNTSELSNNLKENTDKISVKTDYKIARE